MDRYIKTFCGFLMNYGVSFYLHENINAVSGWEPGTMPISWHVVPSSSDEFHCYYKNQIIYKGQKRSDADIEKCVKKIVEFS